MENTLKVERKSRKKSQFFSTESPESLFMESQRTGTAGVVERLDEHDEQDNGLKEKLNPQNDDEDLTINIEGVDIDNLALDGAVAMNALNDVLQKIGIDITGNEAPIKNLKQMSPWEIKSNIQTQIIVHLGRFIDFPLII